MDTTIQKTPLPLSEKRWITIEEFDEVYSISKSTQQRLRKTGLPYSKIGGLIRYDRLKIDEFFSNHSMTA